MSSLDVPVEEKGAPSSPTLVGPDEVLSDSVIGLGDSTGTGKVTADPPSGTQMVGLYLAGGIAAVIVVSLWYTLYLWRIATPPPISMADLPKDPATAKVFVENYRTLVTTAHEDLLKLLGVTVTPLFTLIGTIAGYILGNQSRKSE